MDDGVGDETGVEHAADGTGEHDDKGGAQHLLGAGEELRADSVHVKAGNEAHHHRQHQEHGALLGKVPGQLDAAVDDDHQSHHQGQNAQALAGIQMAKVIQRAALELAVLVQVVHGAQPGILLDLLGVSHQPEAGDNIVYHKAHPAVADAGVVGQLGNLLGHQGGAHVEGTGGEAHGAAQQDDTHAHDGVKPQAQGQHHGNGGKSNKGIHCLGGTDEGKHQHQQGNKDLHPLAEAAHDHGHQGLQGACGGEHVDGTAAEEDQGDEVAVIGKGLHDDHGHLQGVDADVLHVLEGVGVHHRAARDRVLDAGVLAAGDDPGQRHGNGDDNKQDHEGVGHGKALFCFHGPFWHRVLSPLLRLGKVHCRGVDFPSMG